MLRGRACLAIPRIVRDHDQHFRARAGAGQGERRENILVTNQHANRDRVGPHLQREWLRRIARDKIPANRHDFIQPAKDGAQRDVFAKLHQPALGVAGILHAVLRLHDERTVAPFFVCGVRIVDGDRAEQERFPGVTDHRLDPRGHVGIFLERPWYRGLGPDNHIGHTPVVGIERELLDRT